MKSLIYSLFFVGWCCVAGAQEKGMIYTQADVMPYFSGCEEFNGSDNKRDCSNRLLVQFLAENLTYPATAKEEGIEGTVFVSFIIDENGFVHEPAIVRDIGGGCGKVAVDIVRSMPAWEPGQQGGQAVKVKLNLPIQFNLKNKSAEKSNLYKIYWGRLTAPTVSREQLIDQFNSDVFVRDHFGNKISMTELILSYERRRNYQEFKSTGELTDAMQKFIRKLRRGGTLTLTAVVQSEGSFVFVRRQFEVE